MSETLHEKAAGLPTSHGVYLFKGKKGVVLYVGKAINLRARVRQYLSGQDERFMVPFLVRAALDIEVVVVSSEKEALLLENTLIKKHRPKFNVQLRDDKSFLHLRLDPKEEWPHWRLVRKIRHDGARYHGPFHSASKARATLAFLEKSFPLRTCKDTALKSRSRPCLLHQMHRCLAPCVDLVARQAYMEVVDESSMFLDGRRNDLIERLEARMHAEAEELRFEQAARLRDLVRSISDTLERQNVVDTKLLDFDVWGIHIEGKQGAAAVLPVRSGVMDEPRTYLLPAVVGDLAEVLSSLLVQGYPEGMEIPPEVVVPELPSDLAVVEEILSEQRGRKVQIRAPREGDRVQQLKLATDNARVRFQSEHNAEARHQKALEALAEALSLPAPPHRMECFDNSNLQGTDPVAAMSVFLDGKPARAEYRRYRIKTVVGADDYASMREILQRRLSRGIREGNLPDLLVVDGGKGQLAVAVAVAQDLGLHDLPLVGIAKPRTEHAKGQASATDKLFLPGAKDPIRLREGHPGLRIVQHLRDEVHDTAVKYHRKVRNKAQLGSVLEGIPGIGPARRKALLIDLGSAEAVFEADVERLAQVPGVGPAVAAQIWGVLHAALAEPQADPDDVWLEG